MKRILIMIIMITGILSVNAQRNVEKTVNLSQNQELSIDFKFANNIEVKQWNKNEISVKAKVIIDDGEGDEYFSLKTEDEGSELSIYSDFGNYFKRRNKYDTKHNHTRTEINYTVYIPKDISLKVKSISGNLMMDEFNGELVTDLIAGDVTIKKYKGELRLKTISGDLDVTIDKARVSAKTVTGLIYSNLDIDMDHNRSRKSIPNKIRGTINNGSENLKLETVSGNIYLRAK